MVQFGNLKFETAPLNGVAIIMSNMLLRIEAFPISNSVYFHSSPAQSIRNFGRGSHWSMGGSNSISNLEVACYKIYHSGSQDHALYTY